MKKMFLLLGVTVFMLSCGKKNSQPSASASNVDSNPKFDESVALFQQTNTNVQSREKSTKVAYTFEMIDFSGDLTLGNVYKLEGIEYCDNGLFNDEIAGDGIYTSVETFSKNIEKSLEQKVIVNKSENFKYSDELLRYLDSKNSKEKAKGKGGFTAEFGCKVKWTKCPNTTWYNTSLFGESCLNFYDCEFTLGINS